MERTKENTVSSFFYYMWNCWSKEECQETFGAMHRHFWEKWCYCADKDLHGAAERFYAGLSELNRKKLVERACIMYDGRKETFAEDSSQTTDEPEEKIHFGFLGNGVTVWDASKTVNGDYPTVAHIAYDRTVKYYREVSPEARHQIEHYAKYGNIHPVTQPEMLALKPLEVSASISDEDGRPLAITDEEPEVIEVWTTPRNNPKFFRRRVKCLMLSGLPQAEAEQTVSSEPLKMELFYDVERGGFAIDAEAIGNTPLYNPYTGEEIPDETE